MQEPTSLVKVDWSDHEFAKYLNNMGGNGWHHTSSDKMNRFWTADHKLLAIVLYDNVKPDRTIFQAVYT